MGGGGGTKTQVTQRKRTCPAGAQDCIMLRPPEERGGGDKYQPQQELTLENERDKIKKATNG